MTEQRPSSLVPQQNDSNYGIVTGSAFGGSYNHNEFTNVNETHNYLGSSGKPAVMTSWLLLTDLLDEFKLLASHCADNATHDSVVVSTQAKCHPGTREAVLERLTRWATGFNAKADGNLKSIVWIRGPAGTGKSAIERTLAQKLQQQQCLLATFFFFRTDQGRNSSARLIATLAYQLAVVIPSTRPQIETAIQQDPRIFTKSLEEQARSLIIDPVSFLGDGTKSSHRIIIIDGLDECIAEEQEIVLKTLHQITQHTPFAVILASRPEPQIQAAFNQQALQTATLPLALDESLDPDADIRKYLTDVFNFIRHDHPLKSSLPTSDWPPADTIDRLVQKASGQFIYASTIERFISSPRHKPHERLNVVLGIQAAGANRPYEALDDLYSAIFNSVEKATLKHALRIIGVLLVPYKDFITYHRGGRVGSHSGEIRPPRLVGTRSPAFLESLLHLKSGDVRSWLFDLQSLLLIGTDVGPIRFYHASLPDYLRDRSRSGKFYINPRYSYLDVLHHCGRHIFKLKSPIWPSGFIEPPLVLNLVHVVHLLGIVEDDGDIRPRQDAFGAAIRKVQAVQRSARLPAAEAKVDV